MSDAERPDSHIPARRTVLRAAGGAGLLGAAAALVARPGLAAQRVTQRPPASSAEVKAALGADALCDLTPESIEGPFYLPDELVRRDIREDREGVRLRLRLHIMNANTCQPLQDAAVDIWQCDALGAYSGVAKRAEDEQTDESSSFLRGIQITGADGWCDFTTIVPGWYPGRTAHIHTKVHVKGDVAHHHYVGGHVTHVGQVFFTEKLMETIETLPPYSDSTTTRVHNDADSYFHQAGGKSAVVKTTVIVKGQPELGYRGVMVLAVDPKARH